MHCGRKFHPILGLAAAAAALALATVAGAGSLPSLSDSFDDAATLSQWHFIEGDLQDGVAPTFDIGRTTPGELTIVPGRSWWVDGTRAFALMKPVRGDFVATLRLRVTGKDTASPSANWSLSGLLVRRPTDDPAKENWLSFRVGRVNGKDVFERKTTVLSESVLTLSPASTGWVELRIARVGSYFVFLRRFPGRSWSFNYLYRRRDLPAALTVGIDAFSGYGDTKADLVSHVDSIRFASTGVPGPLKKDVLAGKKPTTKLLRFLTRS